MKEKKTSERIVPSNTTQRERGHSELRVTETERRVSEREAERGDRLDWVEGDQLHVTIIIEQCSHNSHDTHKGEQYLHFDPYDSLELR